MQLIRNQELWLEDRDEFSHTSLVFRDNDEFYYAVTPHRIMSDDEIDIQKLSLNLIPTAHIQPILPTEFTQVVNPSPDECYIKRPELFTYHLDKDSTISELVLSEARICERLRQFPHPNIAHYFGCTVRRDRITGLCFRRYNKTLLQLVEEGTLFDREGCMAGIESGIRHLHQLGLVHNDIKPSNIMLATDDTPVIIDFDSCQPEGTKLGVKAGTIEWADTSAEISSRCNDFYGLAKLREFVYGKNSNGGLSNGEDNDGNNCDGTNNNGRLSSEEGNDGKAATEKIAVIN